MQQMSDLFSSPPYAGVIVASIIGFLLLLGFLVELLQFRCNVNRNGDGTNSCDIHVNEHSLKEISSLERNGDIRSVEEQLRAMIQKHPGQSAKILREINSKKGNFEGQ